MPDPYEQWSSMLKHFHDYHRNELNGLIQCENGKPKQLSSLLRETQHFLHGLHMHHTIEDNVVFPFLAQKFDVSGFEKDHKKLDKLIRKLQTAASQDVRGRVVEFDRQAFLAMLVEMKELVFPHMQLEEDMTAPEAMRAAFSVKEMQKLMSRA
ncbi:hypothetical protein HDV00_001678 [Rhizophlyctis rosea]|nr:hypothetical protein HDV00_001678 [Rhizophlyctis rosea]